MNKKTLKKELENIKKDIIKEIDVSRGGLKSVNTLNLQPDDRLVFTYDGTLSNEQHEYLGDRIEKWFPGISFIILCEGMSLTKVSKKDKEQS